MIGLDWDARAVAAFYDAYGEREWTRFEDGRTPAVSIATHAHYLRRFVSGGTRVLDAGSGPGRFALELAAIGARVVLADVSPGQLELSRAKLADVEHAIEARVVADICDLPFEDDAFGATVCFGGSLSYVLDRADVAVAELARVTRPGGHVLVSVMSLVGIASRALVELLVDSRGYDETTIERIVATGILPPADSGHPAMRLYRWRELRELVEAHGEIVAASATGLFGANPDEPELRALLERVEVDLGAEAGAIESGPHILAVVRV